MIEFIFNFLPLYLGRITLLFGFSFILILFLYYIKETIFLKIKNRFLKIRKVEFPEEYRQMTRLGTIEGVHKPFCFIIINDYTMDELELISAHLRYNYIIVGIIDVVGNIEYKLEKLNESLNLFDESSGISRLMYKLPQGVNYHKDEIIYDIDKELLCVYYTLYRGDKYE